MDLDTYPLSNLFVHGALNGLNLAEVSQCLFNMHIGFSLVFTPYLSIVLAKSPHFISCPSSTEAIGIAYKPPRSL